MRVTLIRARVLAALMLCVAVSAGRPSKDERSWGKRREQILSSMQEVMGPLSNGPTGPPAVTVLEEVSFPRLIRRKIEFASGDGDRVPAYILLPRPQKQRGPAVLCLHQTVAIGKEGY